MVLSRTVLYLTYFIPLKATKIFKDLLIRILKQANIAQNSLGKFIDLREFFDGQFQAVHNRKRRIVGKMKENPSFKDFDKFFTAIF